MFSFTKEQKIFEISGVKIGGQPGNLPTVLFGGFFFKGEPCYNTAKQQIKNMYLLSNKTGNPVIPDFFIKKEENLEKIIDFIIKEIPKNKPFSVDIIEPDLKIKTLEILSNKNILKRTVYNSIHIGTTNEERQTLKKHTPEMVIVVAFNPKDKSPDGKIEVLENSAHLLDKGLLDIVKEVGVKKILIDTAALAPGNYSGAAIAAIPVIKEEYGYPTGCAIHNVVEKSSWIENFEDSKGIVDAASNINIPVFGGDFAIFGPIERANQVFPIVAWEDILVSEYTDNYFGITPNAFHPRRKFFK